jgi:FlaA1/EpsC-like NDP-sugar epimerase
LVAFPVARQGARGSRLKLAGSAGEPVVTPPGNALGGRVALLDLLLPRALQGTNRIRRIHPRNFAIYIHDVAVAFLAFVAAYWLRPNISATWVDVSEMASSFAAVAAVVYLYTGLYRHVWEYVSLKDAVNVLRTATIVVLLFLPTGFFLNRLEDLPRTMLVSSWLMLVMFLAGPRLVYRTLKDRQWRGLISGAPTGTPILLIGAGPEAAHFIRGLERGAVYNVVGMITRRADRVGQVIQGVDVLGRDSDLVRVIAELDARGRRPEKLVLVRTDVDGAEIRDLLAKAEEAGCSLARVPPPTDMHAYNDADVKPRPIAIADLLGRPQKRLDRAAMAAMIAGKRVLVTGAGGSIGAELVRQISDAGPSHLGLLDHGEFNLYAADMEVRGRHPALPLSAILADVRDETRIREVIARERPEVVFHAAALKHVPMVELNPLEGLLTNAVGTRNVAAACVASGVRTVVMISTDKAVNPANIMGASKRVAEIYCQAEDLRRLGTRFITVRFGNVLGSTGSVVPLFQKQLEAGGPLTVTHADAERYFMTVREAVELVLEAAALGQARADEGAIYVLDMGAPVKIIDLARQIIRLAGKTPGVDVEIKVVGLRPGEKMSEELFHDEEPPMATDMAGIMIARPRTVDFAIIAAKLAGLEEACRRRDEAAAMAVIADLVPELKRAGPGLAKPQLKVVR